MLTLNPIDWCDDGTEKDFCRSCVLSRYQQGRKTGYNLKWGVLPSTLEKLPVPAGLADFTEGDIPAQQVVKDISIVWLRSVDTPPRAFGAMRQWGEVTRSTQAIKDARGAGKLNVNIGGESFKTREPRIPSN